MPCFATRRNVVIAFVLALIGAALATQKAHAAGASISGTSDGSEPHDMYRPPSTPSSVGKYSLELKPLPMLVSLTPGSIGVAGEFEAKLSPHFAIFANGYYTNVKMNNGALSSAQANQAVVDAIAADTETDGLAAGLRYYGNALADSWYVGGQFGGDTNHTIWAYGDQRLTDDRFDYTTGLEAGYRWLWSSGFLIRVGVGATAIDTRRREVETLTSAISASPGSTLAAAAPGGDGRSNVQAKGPGLSTTFGTEIDLGLGWTF